jgi:hypothetical protein
MELKLTRRVFTDESTIGRLSVNGKDTFWTLEDKQRLPGEKIPGKTAIPTGRFEVVLDHSNRFARTMPHILDVPGFEGVRIHWGNTAKDTEGCILVGLSYDPAIPNFIGSSKIAFEQLFALILEAGDNEDRIWLEIV